jgi:hypothetical protein
MYEAAAAVDSLRTRRFKHGHFRLSSNRWWRTANESGYPLAIVANQWGAATTGNGHAA